MQSKKQLHLVKVTTEIQKIQISVKFPCSLKVHLRSELQSSTTNQSYPLKQGICQINQKLEIKAEVIFDPKLNKYEQTKITLAAVIASSNSNIPAGTATFNPFNQQAGHNIQSVESLQKCSDREAKVFFSQSYQTIKKIKDIQSENIRSSRALNRNAFKNSSFRVGDTQKSISRDKIDLQNSIHESRVRGYKLPPTGTAGKSARQRITTNVSYNQYNAENNIRKENALKSEVQLLNLEVQKYKQKCRAYDRKQRQLNLTIKDLKDNVERKKAKFIQSESSKTTVEMTLSQKQKQIKEYRMQNKKLNDKFQDLRIVNHTLEKKIEVRQKSFQEQLKIYTDKTSLLERQVHKITYEYNSLLQKMETSEKNNQLVNKQKQKQNIQQKTRLIKKIEHLNQQIEKYKELLEERDTKLGNAQSGNKSLSQQNSERQKDLDRLQNEMQVLKAQLKSEKDKTAGLQKDLELLSGADSDRSIFKKKFNDTIQELTKLGEKYARLQSSFDQAQSKSQQLQSKLKELSKSHKQLTHQYSSLTTEHDNLKKQNNNLSNEYNSLSAKHLNQTQKLNDMKSKLDAEKQQFQDMQHHYEDKLNYLLKTKQYSDTEVEDWKDKYEKQEHIYDELSKKYKTLNDDLLRKHQQLLKVNQQVKKKEEKIDELHQSIQRANDQIQAHEKKEKQLIEALKSKGNDSYDLQKKVTQQDQQIFILSEKVQSLEKNYQDSQSNYEKQISEKDTIISKKTNEVEDNKNTIQNLMDDLEKLNNQLQESIRQQEKMQDNIKRNEEQLQESAKQTEGLQNKISEMQAKIDELQNELENQIKLNGSLSEQDKSLSKEWKEYRQATSKALQQLIDFISKDENSESLEDGELLKFPDTNLAEMQIIALKNRNEIITKYREQVERMEQEVQFLKKQNQKTKKLSAQKQSSYQKQIQEIKQANGQTFQKSTIERNQLKDKITELQETIQNNLSQIERHKSSINNLEEIISELNTQKDALDQEIENYGNEITLLEEQILELKSNQIKEKSSMEMSYKGEKDQLQALISSLKQNISQLNQKLLNSQNQKQQKTSEVQKLQSDLQETLSEKKKQINRKQQAEAKIVELEKEKEQLKITVQSKQKNIAELNQIRESLTLQKTSLSEKLTKITHEHKQTYEELTETSVFKEKITKQLEKSQEEVARLTQELDSSNAKNNESQDQKTKTIKEQKQKLNGLESTVEIKELQIKKLQDIKEKNQNEVRNLTKQLILKKSSLVEAEKKIQELKNVQLKIQESSSNYSLELQTALQDNAQHIETIVELESELQRLRPRGQELTVRLEEIEVLKKNIIQLQQEKHKLNLQLKSAQNQTKTTSNKLSSKQEEYRKKILSLETIIEEKEIQLSTNTQQLSSDLERQKANLTKELQAQDENIRNIQQESKFRIDQLENQIEMLNQDCLELSNLLADKEEDILSYQEQNQENEKKITDLSNQLKACLEAWDKEKAAYLPSRKQMTELQNEMGKFQDYATELDSKTKELLDMSKKKGTEQSKFGISQILRELNSTISKSKTKILSRAQSEQEKESIIQDYIYLQDKIDSAMRSHNVLYK